MPLITMISCTKFLYVFYILIETLVIAFYRFSLNGILWA